LLDAQLLAAAIQSRKAFEVFAPHFTVEDFSPISKFWYALVLEWYRTDKQAQSIDRSLLQELGHNRISNKKHEDSLLGFIRDLPEPPSADNVVRVALELKRHNIAMELASAIGSHDVTKQRKLLPVLQQLQEATELTYNGRRTEWQDAVGVDQLFAKVGTENRVPIAPAQLNKKAGGGALPGHHIIVFGRPEAGKSLFSLNMAYGFTKQKKRGIYIGNEDQIDVLKSRYVSRVTRIPWQECEANPERCMKLFRQRGGEDYLVMSQLKHGTMDAVARKLEEDDPFDFVVLDQIRNITASNEDGKMTTRLEIVGREYRELLLDYGLIGVSVTQGNDRTQKNGEEPSIWLGMGDIDSSRTGLPATGDLIVGVGVNSELRGRNQRAISLPKNKLNSEPDAHEGFIVEVEPAISRVR
jgi:hypothetical protein